MENDGEKSPSLKIQDFARRARIFEDCHRRFQEISAQTSHSDVFPDFKFTYENVGTETEAGQNFSSRKFQYPHSPIEQNKLLHGEAELERRGQSKEVESKSFASLKSTDRACNQKSDIQKLNFDRMFCEGPSIAGVITKIS